MSDTWGPFTPKECHQSLAANNPSYAILPVMQKPPWVHSPSSYTEGSSSSLVVAFEDPDGQQLKSLLAAWYLFAFGTRTTVKKWKQWATKHKPSSNSDAKSDNEEDVKILTRARTLTQAPHAVVPLQMPKDHLHLLLNNDSPSAPPPCAPQQKQGRQTRARKPSTLPH